jgi:hypothetical protein
MKAIPAAFMISATLLAFVVGGSDVTWAQTSDSQSCGDRTAVCTPSVRSDKYVYSWDGKSLKRASQRSGERADSVNQRVYRYLYMPACAGAAPAGVTGTIVGDESCTNAVANPACPPGEFAMWNYRRLAGPPQALAGLPGPAPWTRAPGVVCLAADQAWTLPDLTRLAHEHLQKHVTRPHATVQPASTGLAQLPVIAHTPAAGPVDLDVTQPFPGHLHATPTYTWDFAEGPPQPGPGRRYDGTSPTTHPGHYVCHTYHTAGTRPITVTLTWTATFTVAGLHLPVQPITFTDTTTIDIHAARSQLVDAP